MWRDVDKEYADEIAAWAVLIGAALVFVGLVGALCVQVVRWLT